MNYYLAVLKNYVGFDGRARRKEYWMFVLVNFFISLAIGLIGVVTKMDFLQYIYSLAILLPSIAVSIRRMHDIGKSGAYILVSLIPIIGWIWFLILLASEGENASNQYGENPKAA